MTTSRLLERPRLRTLDDDADERRATWTELFFDLVFVAAIAQLAQALSDDPDAGGFVHFAALFVPVWWAWMGFTFYADRFDTDDAAHRVLTLGAMLGVAAIAVNVRDAFGDGWAAFVVSYVAVRGVLVLLYVGAYRFVPVARRLVAIYIAAFGTGIALWVTSALVAAPARYAIWAIGVAIELSAPILGWRQLRHAPVHETHIPERFGLFTIIVLGESVLAVVLGTVGVTWRVDSGVVAAACFVAAAALWWILFNFVDSSVLKRGLFGLFYVYSHLPLVLGLAAFGVATKLAILETPSGGLETGTRWLLCGGVALSLLALSGLELATTGWLRDPDFWLRLGGFAAALALALAGGSLPPAALALLLAALLVALLVLELGTHESHAETVERQTVPSTD